MSCSKIFSGNLPELTESIIKYFRNDFSTLNSCALVNKFWCRLAIPLLWENPFSIIENSISTRNYNFIGIYLHNLNGELKTKFNEYKINDNLLSSNTLFNYPSFIKYLNTWEFISSAKRWSEDVFRTLESKYKSSLEDLGSESDFGILIQTSLLKIFIENEINIHTLEIETKSYFDIYFEDFLELILQNTNFIHNIKNLKLSVLSINCNTPINNRILQIVNSHQNLKKVILCNSKDFLFYQPLSLSKDYNCSNTLNSIALYRINFKDIINLNEMFEQLNVLESIHIIHCISLNTSFIQQILNLTKPFKLKSLFIDASSKIDESLLFLLQKSGGYLENFRYVYFRSELEHQKILESVIEYCKNIKLLGIFNVKDEIVYPVLNLIENIKQNLNCLSISCERSSLDNSSSILLQNLGQILPSKLEYLNLFFYINASDFVIFLKNSQGTFIKKLLIKDLTSWKLINDILPYIKEYIMKEKRVRCLNLRNFKDTELFDFSDEVKEFKLHNIRVQRYSDSVIDNYKFMQKLD
ncbi:hypothetical protein RhiirA1_449116 [Rhizophagus irregularis]|uniref:F-box domain-containing protein n=4 Tax=Rhizophagus irregularis TaxID=588596 RepID=A0A2N0SHU7_9GLOM|nr:hypothetical protein RirG_225790 [Rhizophagus irregularis DAOM 197198w]PKC75134.1 hypothetical protein RhiirA1_449116 [Rhizophagus irregularis]UZO26880.1 hypothetical protein OCT59_019092 [Rhizophagus irregularis]